jgi:hypothetical protein
MSLNKGVPSAVELTSGEVVYKYRWRFLPWAWLVVSISFCLFLGIAWTFRQGWLVGLTFLSISLSCSMLMGWVLLLGVADICVNDEELTKRAFGFVFQRTRWSYVEELRITSSKNPEDGHMVRSFALRSKVGSVGALSWIIIFQERRVGMDALIDKIMRCANTRQFRIVDLSRR